MKSTSEPARIRVFALILAAVLAATAVSAAVLFGATLMPIMERAMSSGRPTMIGAWIAVFAGAATAVWLAVYGRSGAKRRPPRDD